MGPATAGTGSAAPALSCANSCGLGVGAIVKAKLGLQPNRSTRRILGRSRALTVHIIDMGRRLGRGTTYSGLVVGAIAKPKLCTQPKPLGEASTPPGKAATPPRP